MNPLRAKLSHPIAVYYDLKATSPYYGNLYIAELGRCTIRLISASSGLILTIVGIIGHCEPSDNGVALSLTLNQPHSIFGDSDGNLVIADTGSHVLRQYTTATGQLTTIAGTGIVSSGNVVVNGVSPLRVNLSQPFGVWLDKMNNIFISEGNGTAIRMIHFTFLSYSYSYGSSKCDNNNQSNNYCSNCSTNSFCHRTSYYSADDSVYRSC